MSLQLDTGRTHALDQLAVKPGLPPMEARLVDDLPSGDSWRFEPKWDGFRCLVFRAGDEAQLQSKAGKPLGRYFPEVVAAVLALKARELVVDGELMIPIGDALSFEALQMRLHPAASRIRRLASETPAQLMLFDCLLTHAEESLIERPLWQRREALERVFASERTDDIRISPFSDDRRTAAAWLEQAGTALDGVIAKQRDGAYLPGERAMLKVKQMRTADCVVGGFRYAAGAREVGSLLLGLYNERGLLDHVGFTSTISAAERPALTRKLEKLVEPPGFTGDAPGGPSRWNTERTGEWVPLRPKLVVEVRYDHVTGRRFRHGTKFLRWRPDKAPGQCTMEQLQPEAQPAALAASLAGAP